MNGYNGHFEMVNPKEIVIDHRYQRPLKVTLVSLIAQNPKWELFGVPVCFRRKNGMTYAADGQQRIAGVLQSEKPPKEIPIVWFELEELEDEAAVFVAINEYRKALQPIEKHKGKIVARDESALAIERAVAQAGYTIDNNVGTGAAGARTIQAVAAVNWIYNRLGEDGVLQSLTVIRDAWPDDRDGITAAMLRAVGTLIEEQGENYNRTRLTTALKKTQPHLVNREAARLELVTGGSKQARVRMAFASLAGLKMPKDAAPRKK